jgi:hypothetical protein
MAVVNVYTWKKYDECFDDKINLFAIYNSINRISNDYNLGFKMFDEIKIEFVNFKLAEVVKEKICSFDLKHHKETSDFLVLDKLIMMIEDKLYNGNLMFNFGCDVLEALDTLN